MTREWVKCRAGPRISHSPWSVWSQWSARSSTSARCTAQDSSDSLEPEPAGLGQGDHHLAEDVALPLVDGPVADPDRARALVPGQVVELALGQLAAAVDGVHDLEVGGVAGHGPHQPVAPQPGLVDVAAGEQGLEGERGVAQPAVAVVPVPLAADVLGQARRRGGDDAAAHLVGEQAQDEQGAGDGLAVRPVVRVPVGPLVEVPDGVLDPRVDVEGLGDLASTTAPRSSRTRASPGADGEPVAVAVVVGLGEPVAAQDEHVRAGDGADDRLARPRRSTRDTQGRTLP